MAPSSAAVRGRRIPLLVVAAPLVLTLVAVAGVIATGSASALPAPRTDQLGPTASTASPHTAGKAKTKRSWNRHVKCRATVATLHQVLGSKKNKNGGATYRGGGFKPGIPDRRDFTPPCYQKHVPTFVQLNRITLGPCKKINADGDWGCTLFDPSVPKHRSANMSSIHVETDQKFRKTRAWTLPPGGKLLDIQGFVFWDPGHTSESWHHYTGWEIHSLTAWRKSPKR